MDETCLGEGSLFDANGRRKYLHAAEARRLLARSDTAEPRSRLFLLLLYYTGCRVSEALETTAQRLDSVGGRIAFRTLKRRRLIYRAVPIPKDLMRELNALAASLPPGARLFPWCRQTAWRRIKALMHAAAIEGPQATPKGLRHQFGIHAMGSKVPESAVQRWMGHARRRNTQIYILATGAEERALAARMWRRR